MAILYGTTGDGTTLPVLVDQFGNLLAKGIEGQPGTPGTPGKDGEQGPPGADGGDFPLPPDPYEGALLGWLNNELAWLGTPPVPIPEGVFGPITSWDPAGLITVEGDIPAQVAQGVYVYQCNQDGTIYVDGWDNSKIWSDLFITNAEWISSNGAAKAFNADPALAAETNGTGSSTYMLGQSLGIRGENNLEIKGLWSRIDINGIDQNTGLVNNAMYNFGFIKDIDEIKLYGSNSNPLSGPVLYQVLVNRKELVDGGDYPSALNLNFRVQSVNGQNLIGTPNRTDNFSIGKYLRIPQQNVARWLYDGNLSKVITSTGIDISRLTET